jgi:hypothetical protein
MGELADRPYLIPVRLHVSRLWGGGESMHGSREIDARGKQLAGFAAAERHEETGRWYAV